MFRRPCCAPRRRVLVLRRWFCTSPYSLRGFSLTVPYTPIGTIQDFAFSPRHALLPELHRRDHPITDDETYHMYEGPIITTAKGARPLSNANLDAAVSNNSVPHNSLRDTAVDTDFYNALLHDALEREHNAGTASSMYQPDPRSDPLNRDIPEHILSAQRSVMQMQNDSIGTGMRGIIPPPPPLNDNLALNTCYVPPRVQLGDDWYVLMTGFITLFVFLVYFGK